MASYHIHSHNQVQGPYSLDEIKARLKSGIFRPDVQVSVDGGDWQRLSDLLPEIFASQAAPISGTPLPGSDPPPSNPYRPPNSANVAKRPAVVASSDKGIGRLAYVGACCGIVIGGGIMQALTSGSLIATFLTAGLLVFPVHARLENIGMNPLWCFLIFIPLINLFIGLSCLLLPPGYAYYRILDPPAKFIRATLYVFLGFLIIRFTSAWLTP